MRRTKVLLIGGITLFLAAAAVAGLGMMSVQVQNGQLRATPSFLGAPVAPVGYGEQVDVQQQQGDWMQVDAAGKKGWIHQSALSKKRIVLKAGAQDVQTAASSDEVALAGKGFNADVEARYRTTHKNVDYTWVDRMEMIRIAPPEMVAFLNAGGVKPAVGGVK